MNELNKYRILKFELNGGQPSVVIDNLPGFPDNLKITQDNKLIVAIPAIRDSTTNFIDNNILVRKAIINARVPL